MLHAPDPLGVTDQPIRAVRLVPLVHPEKPPILSQLVRVGSIVPLPVLIPTSHLDQKSSDAPPSGALSCAVRQRKRHKAAAGGNDVSPCSAPAAGRAAALKDISHRLKRESNDERVRAEDSVCVVFGCSNVDEVEAMCLQTPREALSKALGLVRRPSASTSAPPTSKPSPATKRSEVLRTVNSALILPDTSADDRSV